MPSTLDLFAYGLPLAWIAFILIAVIQGVRRWRKYDGPGKGIVMVDKKDSGDAGRQEGSGD